MKAQTMIERAVKECYDTYCDYARKVENIPVIPTFPKVTWVRGSLKNEETGWMIDGKLFNGTAEQVVAHWNKNTDRWRKKIHKHLVTGTSYAAVEQELPGMPDS